MIEIVTISAILSQKPKVENIDATLEELQRRVQGDIEILQLPLVSDDNIIVNEEGKRLLSTERNEIAGILYGATLFGNAIVCGPPDADGEFTSITPELRDKIMAIYK